MATDNVVTHEDLVFILDRLCYREDAIILKEFKQYYDMNPTFINELENEYFEKNNCKDFEDMINLIYTNAKDMVIELSAHKKKGLRHFEKDLILEDLFNHRKKCMDIYLLDVNYYISHQYPIYDNQELVDALCKFVTIPMHLGVNIGFYRIGREVYNKIFSKSDKYLEQFEQEVGCSYLMIKEEFQYSLIRKRSAIITKLEKKDDE